MTELVVLATLHFDRLLLPPPSTNKSPPVIDIRNISKYYHILYYTKMAGFNGLFLVTEAEAVDSKRLGEGWPGVGFEGLSLTGWSVEGLGIIEDKMETMGNLSVILA